MSFLGPAFLVKLIPTFSFIIAAVVLVMFSDAINKYIVFPVADMLKGATRHRLHKNDKLAKWASEAVATLIFIAYCFVAGYVLAEYIIGPILTRARSVLLLVLIAVFFGINYVINVERERFIKV